MKEAEVMYLYSWFSLLQPELWNKIKTIIYMKYFIISFFHIKWKHASSYKRVKYHRRLTNSWKSTYVCVRV